MPERPKSPLNPSQIRELIGLEPEDIQELSLAMQAEVYADLGEKFPDLLTERLKLIKPDPKLQRAVAATLGHELIYGKGETEEEHAKRIIAELTQKLGRSPSLSEIGVGLGLTKSQTQKLVNKFGYKSGHFNRFGG